MSGASRQSEVIGGQPSSRIRDVDSDNEADLSLVAALHIELLGFGPLAALGERFVREVCYRVLMDANVLEVAILEVNGSPAGFVAFTIDSYDFHRTGARKHWFKVAVELTRALLTQPQGVRKVARVLRWVASRRQESQSKPGSGGEVVCIAVRPQYLRCRLAGNRRASEKLIGYAAERLRAAGVEEMRMLVERDNKAVLLLYHSLGARFEPYELGGEPQVQVWFNLESLPLVAE